MRWQTDVALALAGNLIGAEGAWVVAEALKVNQAVTQIDLGCE